MNLRNPFMMIKHLVNLKTISCLVVLFLTVGIANASSIVNITVLHDFDSGMPAILDSQSNKVLAAPPRQNQSKDKYNKIVTVMGDLIYDHVKHPVLYVSSGKSGVIETSDVFSLVDTAVSDRLKSKNLIEGNRLRTGNIFLIETLNSGFTLFKVLKIDTTRVKIAWTNADSNTKMFSRLQIEKLLKLKAVIPQVKGVTVFPRNIAKGYPAYTFSKQKTETLLISEKQLTKLRKHKVVAKKLSEIADIALIDARSPGFLVASGKIAMVGNGFLSDFSGVNLKQYLGYTNYTMFGINLDMVFVIQDREEKYILARVTKLTNNSIELQWLYKPDGGSIFAKTKNEMSVYDEKSEIELLDKLYEAISSRDVSRAKKLIEAGANVNISGREFTPLQVAVLKEDERIVNILIDSGAEIDVLGERGLNALHLAISLQNPELVKLLVAKGADPYIVNKNGDNALELAGNTFNRDERIINYFKKRGVGTGSLIGAVSIGDRIEVEKLIKSGAEINAINSKGQTPLILAAELGYIDIMKILLNHGADLSVKPAKGYEALVVAIRANQNLVVEFLLKSGKLSKVQKSRGMYHATLVQNAELVKMFLKEKIDPKLEVDGSSPYTASLKYANKSILKLYADSGFSVPLWAAARTGDVDKVRELLDKGEKVKQSFNQEGISVLKIAIKSRNLELVKLLLENGATINETDPVGKKVSTLQVAVESDSIQIVRLLLENKANINSPDSYGRTPLLAAVIKNNYDIVKVLLDNGADYRIIPKTTGSILNATKNEKIRELLKSYGAVESVDTGGESKQEVTPKKKGKMNQVIVITSLEYWSRWLSY